MSLPLSEFADRLNRIMPVIMKEFVRRNTADLFKVKVTLPQLLVLQFLSEQQEARMTDLAHFLRVSTAAVTGLVDRLVRSGHILRVFDQDDRRIIRIRLTAKGSELMRKINQQRRDMVIHVFGKITESERQDYLRILTRIHKVLTEEEG